MRNELYYENQIKKLSAKSGVNNSKLIAKLKRRKRALEKSE